MTQKYIWAKATYVGGRARARADSQENTPCVMCECDHDCDHSSFVTCDHDLDQTLT